MKKIIISLIAVALVILIGGYFVMNKKEKVTNHGTIKIGATLPLSGDFAIFGEPINKGALIAIDEAKKSGIDVEYIVEDDHSNASGSTNAANKLVKIDKADAVMTATVQEVKPIVSIFKKGNIPLLVTWDSNDFIKSAGDNIFTIGFSTEGTGQKMAEYAKNNLKLSKVAVIPQIDEYSELIANSFDSYFNKLGGQIVLKEKSPVGQNDFRTILAKIKNSGAEGVYFPFPTPDGINPFLKQAKEQNLNLIMMTADGFSLDQAVKDGIPIEGLYFTNVYLDDAKSLEEKYKNKYGSGPVDTTFVSFGYDGVKTLIEAIDNSRKNNIKVADALRKLNIKGTDRDIDFKGGQFSEKVERVYKVVNKKIIEVQK
jgi:branched-chain amino acid transport system substrate-binding protein